TTTLGTALLDNTGTALFTTSALSQGTHALVATYLGDPNIAGSTCPGVIQQVMSLDTRTTLTASSRPAVFAQTVTLTASVAAVAPGSATPQGTVTFLDSNSTLGTALLDSAGTATLAISDLSPGTHWIAARYAGYLNDISGSAAWLTLDVEGQRV